jgi:hypothetical protein
MPRWTHALALLLGVASAAGCTRLPEPDSPGAKLYAARCTSCHRAFAPSSMKFEMWRYQVERKQGEFVRRGLPPLTPAEIATLLDYLRKHSG